MMGRLRCWRGCRPKVSAEPIERALQDKRGRMLVDHRGALGAADIGRDQFALDRGGGEPLVPERDRQFGAALRGCARRRASIARAGLRVPSMLSGSPSTKPDGAGVRRQVQQARGIGREFLRAMVSTPAASLRSGSRDGDADGLGAEVETDQRPRARASAAASTRGNDECRHPRCAIMRRSREANGAVDPALSSALFCPRSPKMPQRNPPCRSPGTDIPPSASISRARPC